MAHEKYFEPAQFIAILDTKNLSFIIEGFQKKREKKVMDCRRNIKILYLGMNNQKYFKPGQNLLRLDMLNI